MRILQENPDLTQRELADKLGMSVGGLNYCLNALIDKGLVKMQNFSSSKNKFKYVYLKFNTSGTQVVDFIGNRCPIADYKAGLDRFSGVGSANSKAANSDF